MAMNPRLLRPTSSSLDLDAAVYLNAVAQADGEQLEPAVRKAINDFVVGCKRDGIWGAIKASCILMGARTLSGALTPLVGGSPTNVNNNFVSGDYDRETGLLGDGVGKCLDTNRNANADGQNNFHMSFFLGEPFSTLSAVMGAGGASSGSTQIQGSAYRSRSSLGDNVASVGVFTGFVGMSRSAAATFIGRDNATTTSYTRTSQAPVNANILTHARNSSASVPGLFAAMRISFYSVGESLDLVALETRVAALSTAIGNAIP